MRFSDERIEEWLEKAGMNSCLIIAVGYSIHNPFQLE